VIGIVVALLKPEWSLSTTQISLLNSVTLAASALGAIIFGRKLIQILGFAMMALSFALIGFIPSVSINVAPFIALYGISYFFTEFGPNMTTFIYPAELCPVAAVRGALKPAGLRNLVNPSGVDDPGVHDVGSAAAKDAALILEDEDLFSPHAPGRQQSEL
jgi:MFS family permease